MGYTLEILAASNSEKEKKRDLTFLRNNEFRSQRL